MTHDELLAKIDYYLVPTNKLSGDEGVKNSAIGFMQALRAVVELHKPFEEDGKILCSQEECYYHLEFMDRDNCSCVYPCPTIQAITDNLK